MHQHRALRPGGTGGGSLDCSKSVVLPPAAAATPAKKGILTASALRSSSGPYEGKIAGLYDLEETLGRGHFAVVKLARHVFTGEKVAVKVIDKSKLDEVSKAHLFQEVRCMKLVQHPNVVRLYEVIDTATKLYLILELGDGGDLYDYIMRHEAGLSEKLAQDYFRQIVRAISYCHRLHVVHRDLKPENVVFFEKLGVVKLTDFGFSNKFLPGQKLETSCGSLAYSAPEILLGDSYDAPAVDVWSLGVILYMLVCGQAPFQEANDSETLTMIMDCKYQVPAHVSKECQDLIARMLVRNPEKRATLAEISNHAWLATQKTPGKSVDDDEEASGGDILPLVSREQLSDEDHNLIVQKIVNGKIATKEEIQECLDKNEYNHITATYYLLAERKLRSKRQLNVSSSTSIGGGPLGKNNSNKRPDQLGISQNSPSSSQKDNNNSANFINSINNGQSNIGVNSNGGMLLTVPRTPGDIPQRSRKCSIVQEDEEEEDCCGGGVGGRREDLAPPSLNRRGSRSEGRLNLAVQERLLMATPPAVTPPIAANPAAAALKPTKPSNADTQIPPTTVITESSTISIPIITAPSSDADTPTKYKTMPSPPTAVAAAATVAPSISNDLNEIFEEGGDHHDDGSRTNRSNFRSAYEQQRRTKFHKARTASCSSSDASDDDSEKRKKRAHKLGNGSLNATHKPFQGRRDSHDDSSDSQEPSTGRQMSNNNNVTSSASGKSGSTTQNGTAGNSTNHGGGGGGGSKKMAPVARRQHQQQQQQTNHKSSRRRNGGETRLRESQSLNRITEVQEDCGGVAVTTVVVTTASVVMPIVDGSHVSRKDSCASAEICHTAARSDKNTTTNKFERNLKKIKLLNLGKLFQIHTYKKKLSLPLPNLFSGSGTAYKEKDSSKSRLYKAHSCGSLSRDKIVNLGANAVVSGSNSGRQRAVSVARDSGRRQSTVVHHLNDVCTELTGICAVHLGHASKCCSSIC